MNRCISLTAEIKCQAPKARQVEKTRHKNLEFFTWLLLGFWILASGLSLNIRIAIAQESPIKPITAQGCREQTYSRLSQVHRIGRQILFGRERAEDMTLNSVRYDEDGNPWMKMEADEWRSGAKDLQSQTWTDARMDAETEWEGMNEIDPQSRRSQRTGAFAITGVTTSELVHEYVIPVFRGYACRLEMVCQGVRASFLRQQTENGGLLSIETPGCQEMVMEPMDECRFSNVDPAESANQRNIAAGADITAIETECGNLAQQLIEKEAAFLRVAVAYDAAHRSLLQFAGGFDRFLDGLRGDFLAPVEQVLPLLSAFSRIPCFAAQCNE